jgi:nucleoside-diphosphate-sugar epimerase
MKIDSVKSESDEKGKVLVTGGAGYIGSVMVEILLAEGYDVTVLDRFFFGRTLAQLEDNPRLKLVKDDVRWIDPAVFQGLDAVIDLAALSNDPAGELDPEKTLSINHKGRAGVARLAREAGVRRYILASSCSIYGFQEGILDETSPVNPLTTYAQANYLAEQDVLPLATDDFCVTVLRQATVYGSSRRMRFDLAINGMTLGLSKHGKIPILRDGSQWRPMVHVKDTSRAFLRVLDTDPSQISGQIFNVGSDDQNFQILPLARRVAEATDLPFEYEWYGDPDHRSYQVSFKKITETLGYGTLYTPEDAASEIYNALQQGTLDDGPITKTVDWYRQLQYWHETLQNIVLNDTVL